VSEPIAIVGSGALGLLLAALLREGGASVSLLDHDLARARRIAASGITVDGRVVDGIGVRESLPETGIVLVCVKAGSDAAVAARLSGLKACVTVVTLGNGLGRAEALASLGRERVLFGSTAEGATLEGEGRVRHAGRGPTRIAPLVASGAGRAAALVRRLTALGLDARLEADATRLAWEKLQVNAAINAIAGILDRENGAVLEGPEARLLATQAAVEAGLVARALGVSGDWSKEQARLRWETVARATATNLCSTVQDLRKARKSEVHAINGAIARSAREAGIETPVNALLAALVAAREELVAGKAWT
jgi:2-dehydropantoate 2-reductase